MSEAMFVQKVEDLDEILLHPFEEDQYRVKEDISVFIGRASGKLYGIKIVDGNEKRDIWLSDIDRIAQIVSKIQGS